MSKTKCLFFPSRKNAEDPAPIMLRNTPLPWVVSWPHLGHEINKDNLSRPYNSSLDEDALSKMKTFIGKFYSLKQEFGFLEPDRFFDIVNIYATSFYGSNLWLFSGASCGRVFSNWDKMLKVNWNLPWATHRYLMEEVSQSSHLRTKLFLRFLTFIRSSSNSKKRCLSALVNRACKDEGSITKQNLNLIEQESGLDNILELSNEVIAQNIKYSLVPEGEEWRIAFFSELIQLRQKNYYLEFSQFTEDELNMLLEYVCTT